MANTELFKARAMGKEIRNYRLIKNSATIKVGDWIKDDSTGANAASANTDPILGMVTAIVTANKTSLESATPQSGTDYDGTWTASTRSYVASASNQTGKGVMVEYIEAEEGDRFMATLSAAKGSTTGSNLPGYYLAISGADSSKLDETTASTSSTNTQFRITSAYNEGTTTQIIVKVLVRANE